MLHEAIALSSPRTGEQERQTDQRKPLNQAISRIRQHLCIDKCSFKFFVKSIACNALATVLVQI